MKVKSLLAAVCLTLIGAAADAQSRREPGQMFDRLDVNGDDVIDPQELEAARRSAFERADANHDGYASGGEMSALADELREAGPGRRGAMVRRLAQRRSPDSTEERAARLDTDNDGRISETEFLGAPNLLQERFDSNGDGRITREEMDETRASLREEFQRRRGTR